jgi:hypothetical protein
MMLMQKLEPDSLKSFSMSLAGMLFRLQYGIGRNED